MPVPVLRTKVDLIKRLCNYDPEMTRAIVA